MPTLSLPRTEPALDAPAREQVGQRFGDEEARAVLVVALRQKIVVLGQRVPRIGDEREKRRVLRRCDAQARTVYRVIDDRVELMRWQLRREMAEGGGDGGAGGHRGSVAVTCRPKCRLRLPTRCNSNVMLKGPRRSGLNRGGHKNLAYCISEAKRNG